MKNNKGLANLLVLAIVPVSAAGVTATVISFKLLFASVAVAAIWHIPAWDEAKKNHTEAIYQAQQMWPQQVFNQIPSTEISYKYGNGGNFAKGMQN